MSAKQLNSRNRLRALSAAIRLFLLAGLLALVGCSTLPSRQTETLTTLGFSKVDEGWKLVLPDLVLFDFDKADLKPELRYSIADVAHQLLVVQIRQVRVEGHTDNVGPREYNQDLSLRRSKSVAAVITAEGFDPANVETKGYGPDRPVSSNATEKGRSENRRVEIIVLSNVLAP